MEEPQARHTLSSTGRLGREYTAAQLATAARLYDLFTWQYAGSGVTGFLHQRRPDIIVMHYADLTWVGDYDLLPGLSWMPFDWGYVELSLVRQSLEAASGAAISYEKATSPSGCSVVASPGR
ncbi:MAG: hypothetical protein WDA71_04325 [Actinomycetota bacterium]